MSLKLTIEKASAIAGSQRKLAEMLGETEQHVSSFKTGKRPCGMKKRLAIGAIAGEDPTRTMLVYMAEELSDEVPHEAAAKKALSAILSAFPVETDEPLEVAKERWRKR